MKTNSYLLKMYRDNPELMGRLMLGERVDIGDGLEIQMIEYTIHEEGDQVDFEFYLEGRCIGNLDHNHGGHIYYDLEGTIGVPDLQVLVTDRMIELFPKYSEEVFADLSTILD